MSITVLTALTDRFVLYEVRIDVLYFTFITGILSVALGRPAGIRVICLYRSTRGTD